MLDHEWQPENMAVTEELGYKVKPPNDGHVSAGDAERLMVVYQNLSEDWANHYANATYFKETARFKRDAVYNLAFLKSEAKSDRQRDIDAKQDPSVRIADQNLNEAMGHLRLAELRYDGSVRAYHAMKKICEMAHEERKFL